MKVKFGEIDIFISNNDFHMAKAICNDEWTIIYPDGTRQKTSFETTPQLNSNIVLSISNFVQTYLMVEEVNQGEKELKVKELELEFLVATKMK